MKAILLFVLLACTALGAAAQEQAFTNRSTEMKETASADAKTVASLPDNTPVKVLARQGAWTRVDASGKQGFVRLFHLRFPATVTAAGSSAGSSLAGVGAALGFGRSDAKANLATTGVRGLSPEDLKNASPDPEALKKLHTYSTDKATAERFAREGKLSTVAIEEGAAR